MAAGHNTCGATLERQPGGTSAQSNHRNPNQFRDKLYGSSNIKMEQAAYGGSWRGDPVNLRTIFEIIVKH